MKNNKNQRISFVFPPDTTLLEIIDDILNKNGLKESPRDYFSKFTKGVESYTIIIKDAAISLFQKKVPEKIIIELLIKLLEISKERAEKILDEVKQRLVPYVRIIQEEEKSSIRHIEKMPIGVKKIKVMNVEENAKKLKEEGKTIKKEFIVTEEKGDQKREKKPDLYREPIE